MQEPTDQERALWERLKALDDRIQAVDNVPRVSLDFDGAEDGQFLCICAKMWSETHQEAMYVESWYSPELIEGGIDGAISWLNGPMGIQAVFEQKEALREARGQR